LSAIIYVYPGVDPDFVGSEVYTLFGAIFKRKKYKITNTKLGTKVDIYLGLLPGNSKGPVQIKDPES